MKSALIIGGDSAIGKQLADALKAQNTLVHRTTRRPAAKSGLYLDLQADFKQWPYFPLVDVAYVCAAIANLDMCETQPDVTNFINVSQTQVLIKRLLDQNSHVVFFSTNQVFDGKSPLREDTDKVCPESQYGLQKSIVENWLSTTSGATSLRLTKVIDEQLPIVNRWRKSIISGEMVEAFTDVSFAPVPVEQVIAAALLIGNEKLYGIYHMSGHADISYFEAAQELIRLLHADPRLARPISAATQGMPPQLRPRYTSLKRSAAFADFPQAAPFNILYSTIDRRNL